MGCGFHANKIMIPIFNADCKYFFMDTAAGGWRRVRIAGDATPKYVDLENDGMVRYMSVMETFA